MKKIIEKTLVWTLFLGFLLILSFYFFREFLYVYKNWEHPFFEVFRTTGAYIALVSYFLVKRNLESKPLSTGGFAKYLSLQKKLLPSTRRELKHSEEKLNIPPSKTNGRLRQATMLFFIVFLQVFASVVGWALIVDVVFENGSIAYQGVVTEKEMTERRFNKSNSTARDFKLHLHGLNREKLILNVSRQVFYDASVGKDIIVTYQKGILGFEKMRD